MLAVAGEDAAAAAACIEESFLAALDEPGRRAAQATIDLDAEQNACPACGEPFQRVPARCPACGLRISA